MAILTEEYIAAWCKHDKQAILSLLTPDVTIIESFGPIYRGHERVEQWIIKWLDEGAQILDWTIHSSTVAGNQEFVEWTFSYTWEGEEKCFDGITTATVLDGKIYHLREYATTADLYDWTGVWRTKG